MKEREEAYTPEDGIKFFRSANGVILTTGESGVLLPKYFAKVAGRDGSELPISRETTDRLDAS
jgi:hypothetical protein